MKRNISFHRVSWFDCLFLYHLRNQPETYKFFRNNFPVRFHDHFQWFRKLMSGKSNKQLFVVILNSTKVGQIRFDKIEKDGAEISISILKDYMGQNIMSSVFFDVARAYLIKNPEINKLYANIILNNIPSINLFKKLKFKKTKRKNHEWVYLKKRDKIL